MSCILTLMPNATDEADFVAVHGDGRTLLGRDTEKKLNLLRIGPILLFEQC